MGKRTLYVHGEGTLEEKQEHAAALEEEVHALEMTALNQVLKERTHALDATKAEGRVTAAQVENFQQDHTVSLWGSSRRNKRCRFNNFLECLCLFNSRFQLIYGGGQG